MTPVHDTRRAAMDAPPKLRNDLTIRRQQAASGTFFVVKDPVSGSFFRFREAEQFVAQQLDGTKPLEVIRQKTEEAFGATLSIETLEAFVAQLERSGLLETEETAQRHGDGRQGRLRGSLLYLRFRLCDPTPLFDRLLRRVRFLFTPYAVACTAATILLGVGVAVASWNDYRADVPRFYRLSATPLFLAAIFVVASAHEFAHSLTCKHFGGEVHEIGFMLIYFQPGFYCNVSDAWLFPEKSKRLWVGFAGPYFELCIWALAVLAWRLTDVETGINYVSLIVMTIAGMRTLLNLTPLLKLDGYYLLSDFLEIPNLRKKSFKYVGGAVQRLLGLRGPAPPDVSPRERRIYLAYGLIAAAASSLSLAYAVARWAASWASASGPAALLLSTGFVGVKVRSRFRKLFGRSSDASDDDDDPELPAGDASRPAGPAEEVSRSWRRRIGWAAATGAGLALLCFGHTELRIAGPVEIFPEENADVRNAVEGIVDAIEVNEGDMVRAGDVIARLSNTALVNDLRKTEAEIREARANRKKLEAGPTPEEIAVATAAVTKAADQLTFARGRLSRARRLVEENLAPRNQVEDAQQQAVAAEHDLAEARSRLNLLLRGPRPEELEAARARVDQLETQQHYLQEQLKLLNVVSPVAGVVATPATQLKAMQRQFAAKGTLIAKIFDSKTVTAQINISERDLADVRVGQRVEARARAYPDLTFSGTVASVGTSVMVVPGPDGQPQGGPGSKRLIVTTQIDNSLQLLKSGMTGQAKISCGQRRIIDLMTRRLARTVKVEFWRWW